MSDGATTEDVEGLVKGIIDGVFAFIDAEVLPLEERYRTVLADERQLFREDGRLVDEIAEAQPLTVEGSRSGREWLSR